MDPKFSKDVKRFSQITNLALTVISTIAIGIGFGMLIDYLFDTKYWVVIMSLFFTFSAIVNLIRSMVRIGK